MRIAGDGLDPNDQLPVRLARRLGRWSSYLLGGDGYLVVGTYGAQSTSLGALGLIVRKPVGPHAASAAAN
jgi:hypothetical protein